MKESLFGGDRCQINLLTPKLINFPLSDIPNKLKLNSGDIVITRKGTAGVTSIISDDCKNIIIGTEIIKVKLKKDAEISPESGILQADSGSQPSWKYKKQPRKIKVGFRQHFIIFTIERMKKDFEIIIRRYFRVDKVDSDVSFIRTSDLPNYEIDDWTKDERKI